MNLNNISAWSIRNPVVPIVLFVALTIAGIMSFMNMDVQNDPDIEFPVVVVSISQPGAAPTEITTQITQKVESAIRSVQGVRNIDATSSEGNTTVSALKREHSSLGKKPRHLRCSKRDEFSSSGATNKSNSSYGRYDNDNDGISNSYDKKPESSNGY